MTDGCRNVLITVYAGLRLLQLMLTNTIEIMLPAVVYLRALVSAPPLKVITNRRTEYATNLFSKVTFSRHTRLNYI